MVVVTLLVAIVAMGSSWSAGPWDAHFAFWLAACVIGEMLWVQLPIGQATLSMALACNFAAMLLLPIGQAMTCAFVSTLIAESAFMRKSATRFIFNASQSALAAGAGILVLGAVMGGDGHWHMGMSLHHVAALAAAALAYAVVNSGSVSAIVSLDQRISAFRVWRSNFGAPRALLSSVAQFSLGVFLAVLYVFTGPEGAMLVALPLFLIRMLPVRDAAHGQPAAPPGTAPDDRPPA
jgi:hypothetical protein